MGRSPDAVERMGAALARLHAWYRFFFPGTPPWYAAGTLLALWLLRLAKPAAEIKRIEEMHSEFRDNPFIRSGFRPTTRSLRACLRSVFSVHNETFNVRSAPAAAARAEAGGAAVTRPLSRIALRARFGRTPFPPHSWPASGPRTAGAPCSPRSRWAWRCSSSAPRLTRS